MRRNKKKNTMEPRSKNEREKLATPVSFIISLLSLSVFLDIPHLLGVSVPNQYSKMYSF